MGEGGGRGRGGKGRGGGGRGEEGKGRGRKGEETEHQNQSKVPEHVGELQEMVEVPPHLEVVVLSLLFCLQVEPGQPSQVLLTHCLVHLDSHTEITHE